MSFLTQPTTESALTRATQIVTVFVNVSTILNVLNECKGLIDFERINSLILSCWKLKVDSKLRN